MTFGDLALVILVVVVIAVVLILLLRLISNASSVAVPGYFVHVIWIVGLVIILVYVLRAFGLLGHDVAIPHVVG